MVMEPPNFNHPQDQFSGYFSSLLSLPPSEYKPVVSTSTPTNKNTHFLNSQDHLMLSGNSTNRSSYHHNYHHNHHHPLGEASSDHDYSWPASHDLRSGHDLESLDANELLLISKMKDDVADRFLPKLSDMNMYSTTTTTRPSLTTTTSTNNHHHGLVINGYNLSTPTFSSDHHHHHRQFYPNHHHNDSTSSTTSYAHVMPSINVLTTSDLCSSSSSLDLNVRAADHHHGTSSRNSMQISHHHFTGDNSPSSHSSNNNNTCGFDQQQVSAGKKSKRPIGRFSEESSSSKNKDTVNPVDDRKKKRSTSSKPSCPPLKVRKEKLGDRIASLQRLVAPYGKTDTASVLTEAIGYIQFLHDQVQTLSVPYMRSSPNSKPTRAFMQRSSSDQEDHYQQQQQQQQQHQHHHHELLQKKDLKSRGLCLVPLSFASYLNGYNLGI